jgi:glycosyltransferase involved in cell wall biosynthesis
VNRPDVTILCATRNGGAAVRLTLSSLRRFTSGRYRLLIADNGSTDGTREYLSRLDWIELFKRDPRRNGTSHGAALDWLAQKVTTRYFLTLDSDVVFLRRGWLDELHDALNKDGRTAVGEFESGIDRYRPRLAPHVLLLNTDRFRALRCSFESCVLFSSRADVRRWQQRPATQNLDYAEMGKYPSAVFYSTGALLFERMLETGARWSVTPVRTQRKYQHLRHMSWGGDETRFAGAHHAKLAQVRALLERSV